MIKSIRSLDYDKRLKKLNLPSLKYRRLRGDLITAYKYFCDPNVTNFQSLFHLAPCDKTRKHEQKLFVRYARTNIRKFFFSNRITNQWNNLPVELKFAPNINTFKNLLDDLPKLREVRFDYDQN